MPGFRGTRSLIGQADGNALQVRSAKGIDRKPRPVPRRGLCWRSSVSLKAIYCEYREEYKEGETENAHVVPCCLSFICSQAPFHSLKSLLVLLRSPAILCNSCWISNLCCEVLESFI